MAHGSTAHEVLAVVFQVRGLGPDPRSATPELSVLLWQRAQDPQRGAWSLPGGRLRHDEDMMTSVRRQLAEKVDLREVAHLEQLAVFSEPDRVPGTRTIASTFLGLVPSPATPELPPDTRWHPVTDLPQMAFDHGPMVAHARTRLVAKMSYTNIGFALAPTEFALSTLRDVYSASLGHQVDTTNLQRVLARRGVISPTGTFAQSGRSGGRPAALYRFADSHLRVTDEFAALRPPGSA
jgi:ADP-ribose pyrophosphatase YjhB (NUDIX family)